MVILLQMSESKRYPLKLCLLLYDLDINFKILKTDYFHSWFFYKSDLRISATETIMEIERISHIIQNLQGIIVNRT